MKHLPELNCQCHSYAILSYLHYLSHTTVMYVIFTWNMPYLCCLCHTYAICVCHTYTVHATHFAQLHSLCMPHLCPLKLSMPSICAHCLWTLSCAISATLYLCHILSLPHLCYMLHRLAMLFLCYARLSLSMPHFTISAILTYPCHTFCPLNILCPLKLFMSQLSMPTCTIYAKLIIPMPHSHYANLHLLCPLNTMPHSCSLCPLLSVPHSHSLCPLSVPTYSICAPFFISCYQSFLFTLVTFQNFPLKLLSKLSLLKHTLTKGILSNLHKNWISNGSLSSQILISSRFCRKVSHHECPQIILFPWLRSFVIKLLSQTFILMQNIIIIKLSYPTIQFCWN